MTLASMGPHGRAICGLPRISRPRRELAQPCILKRQPLDGHGSTRGGAPSGANLTGAPQACIPGLAEYFVQERIEQENGAAHKIERCGDELLHLGRHAEACKDKGGVKISEVVNNVEGLAEASNQQVE